MNKRHGVFIYVVIGLLLVMLGCRSDIRHTDTSAATATSKTPAQADKLDNPNAAPKLIVSLPSWPHVFTFGELVNTSDLIVEGTIDGIEETRALPPLDSPAILTDFRLNISKILKSYPGFDEQSIVIIQHGGTWQDTTRMMEGNDLFQPGEEVLLFLHDASDSPIHTPKGKTKFGVLMPGGRFTINNDRIIETAMKDSPVADEYRGKNISVLEDDIVASIPAASYYLENAASAFLIVEGTVGEPTSRLVEQEDTKSVFTVYPFKVEQVINDELVRAQNAVRKTNVYERLPVNEGDTITIFERGGTYKDITQRWAWSWGMQPGSRMLLFLGVFECGDKPIICTQEELDSDKAIYLAGGGERFLIDSDNKLSAVTRTFFSRFYDGQSKEQLEQDLAEAKKNQPAQPSDLPPPPLPTIIPTPEP